MLLFAAPVQVEIVNSSNIWTDYVLPITAILISLGTMIWSIWNNQRDKAKIRISVSPAQFLTEGAQPMLSITATQIGQSGKARVTSMGFLAGKQGWQLTRPSRLNPCDTQLPKTLEAGDEAIAFYEISKIAEVCRSGGIDPKVLRPFVRTTRKRTIGKMPKEAIEQISRLLESPEPQKR